METTRTEPLWKVWIDTANRIISFHEADGCQVMEFRSRETLLNYVFGFVGKDYRYQ